MLNKKGFILIDSVICIFVTFMIVFIIFSFYILKMNYKKIYENQIIENYNRKEMILSKLNYCIVEKDLYLQE